MKKRSGIAVLSAVLVSAIILVAIVAVTGQVVPEKIITTSDDALKRALSAAEAGVAQSISDLKTAAWTTGDDTPVMQAGAYLTGGHVLSLLGSATGGVVDCGQAAFPSGDARVTYHLKLVKVAGTRWNFTSGLNETQRVRMYSLGEVRESASGAVIGRRIVTQEFSVPINLAVNEDVFGYGLLALGGKINTQGQDHVHNGSIRANGDITTSGGGDRVDPGYYMYSTGNIWANPVSARMISYPPFTDWVLQKEADYIAKAAAWKQQLIAVINDPALTALVSRDLGSGSSSTIDGVNRFCKGVKNFDDGYQAVNPVKLALVRSMLTTSGWYWVDGDTWLKQDDLKELEGTIAIHGDLQANGGAESGSPTLPRFVVFGDFKKGNGGAVFNGMVYLTGEVKKLTGGMTVYGSIVTEKTIDKINIEVNYRKTEGMPGLGTGSGAPAGTFGAVSAVTAVSNTWGDETGYTTFTDLH